MAISQAAFDALVARVTALEAANVVSDARIDELELHTVSRSTINGLITVLEKDAALATVTANVSAARVSDFNTKLQAIKVSILTILDGMRVNETVTGTIDGANRDFVTKVPYQPGSLVVAIDNKIYYGTTFVTETDNTTGEFETLITPGATQKVKALFYKELGS